MNTLFGHTKPYTSDFKGKSIENYIENEWRYVVVQTEKVPWLDGKTEYENWRGSGKIKPMPSDALKEKKLVFQVNDIAYLITNKEIDKDKLSKDIMKLKSICGKVLTDDDKLRLVSKIISFEQIEADF